MNYTSTSNIREVIKFYNLGDKTFETDFNYLETFQGSSDPDCMRVVHTSEVTNCTFRNSESSSINLNRSVNNNVETSDKLILTFSFVVIFLYKLNACIGLTQMVKLLSTNLTQLAAKVKRLEHEKKTLQ